MNVCVSVCICAGCLLQKKFRFETYLAVGTFWGSWYVYTVQSWPKKFVLGCVIPPVGEITQPRTNFFGQLCICKFCCTKRTYLHKRTYQ